MDQTQRRTVATVFVASALPMVGLGVLVVRWWLGKPTQPPFVWGVAAFFSALGIYCCAIMVPFFRQKRIVSATDEGLFEDAHLVAPWSAVTSVRWLADAVEFRASSAATPLLAGVRAPDEQERVVELARRRAPQASGEEFAFAPNLGTRIEGILVVSAITLVPPGMIALAIGTEMTATGDDSIALLLPAAAFLGVALLGGVPVIHHYVSQLRTSFSAEGILRGTRLVLPWREVATVVLGAHNIARVATRDRKTTVRIDLNCWREPGRVLAMLRRHALRDAGGGTEP